MHRGPFWTLADLVEITTDRDRLQSTLVSTPDAARIASQHMAAPSTFANTVNMLAAGMEIFDRIAAATKALPPQRRMGIDAWSRSKGSVLLLEADSRFPEELGQLYRLIFDTTVRHAVDGLASPTRWKNWFFLEDLDSFPAFAALPRLLTSGQAFGARVALSCMDIENDADARAERNRRLSCGQDAPIIRFFARSRLTPPTGPHNWLRTKTRMNVDRPRPVKS